MIKSEKSRKKRIAMIVMVLIIIILVLVVMNILSGGVILTGKNLLTVLAGSVVPTIVALGFAFVFSGNVTDLSPGSIVILASTVTGLLGNSFGPFAMIIGGVAVGIGCLTLNYSIYRVTKIPPWIAGLGMTMVYEAIAVSYANWCADHGQKIVVLRNELRFMGKQPGLYVCWLIAIVLAYILFNHTAAGIKYRASGDNEEVAKAMGINVDKAMIIGGVMAGMFFGFAGVVKEGYASFVNAQSGLSTLSTVFQPMAATLLAMAFSNFINLILAVPVATFLITLVFNVLTIFGVPSGTFQDTLLGIIVVVFAILAQRDVKGVVK